MDTGGRFAMASSEVEALGAATDDPANRGTKALGGTGADAAEKAWQSWRARGAVPRGMNVHDYLMRHG